MNSKRIIAEGMGKICFIMFLIAFLVLPIVFAQADLDSTTFTSQDQFVIPDYNSAFSFATGGSYRNASLVDNIWHFTGLILGGPTTGPPKLGRPFSVSAQNCKLTITHFDMPNVFPPFPGWLEYTVSGVGNQTFNLHYAHAGWLSYTVYVDGEAKAQNDGWTVSKDGWITVTGATFNVRIHYQCASGTFRSADIFAIPEYNSSIKFAFDGTYVYANLENNTWRFQNLVVNGYVTPNAPTWYLSASARNCNVTITSYCAPFGSHDGWINYTVAGVGNQTLDNNHDRLGGWPINYTVYIDGTARAQNDSWTVSDDGWLTVTGATSNVTIIYKEIIPDWVKDAPHSGEPELEEPNDISAGNNTILYAIVTAVVIVVVAAAAVLALRRKKQTKT